MVIPFKDLQARLSRGRRSRNKVSVGEPAEGSLSAINAYGNYQPCGCVIMLLWAIDTYIYACTLPSRHKPFACQIFVNWMTIDPICQTTLSTLNLLVTATMKNAAKCENVLWIAESGESLTLLT